MTQQNARTWAVWGGVVIVLIVLTAITFRSAWMGGSDDQERGTSPDYPEEFRASESDFDMKASGSAGVDRAIESLSSRVSRELDELGLDPAASSAMVQTLTSRVRMHLSPDYDAWLRLAGDYAPAEARSDHPENAEFRRIWKVQAETFRGTSLDIDSVIVRRIDADAGPVLDVPGTIFIRSGGSGSKETSYPDPPKGAPSVEVIETLIPMKYKLSESENIPVNVSYRFYRKSPGGQWQPTDLYLYFGQEAFGKGLTFPIN